MNEPDVPAGHVRALIERPHDEVLEEAARALLAGRDASTIMHAYFGIAAEAGFTNSIRHSVLSRSEVALNLRSRERGRRRKHSLTPETGSNEIPGARFR